MKLLATRKSDQNVAALDPWTVVHFAVGLAAGLVDLSRTGSMGAALGYEVVEQLLERRRLGQELFETSRPETLPNVLADLAVFAIGHRLGELWNDT